LENHSNRHNMERDMIAHVKPRLGKHIKPVVIVAWTATGNL
jgi:hypothetical protein